jgi:NADPH-dependent 2,4-dienoyl-CoA reductase/sulfur reductase-like enzyme
MSKASSRHVVVVGASLAGLRACEALRQQGFTGRVTLVGDEPDAPYNRPPLSKKFLAGAWGEDRLVLRRQDDFAPLDLTQRYGVAAVGLDTGSKVVRLADSGELAYDAVVIATGCAARTLTTFPLGPRVHQLRTLADARRLAPMLVDGVKVVILGAGFIGLEVAATAVEKGCRVTVLEGQPAPLVRAIGATLGSRIAEMHRARGVDVRCGVSVTGLVGADAAVTGVLLADGSVLEADVVVVGVGAVPNTGWLDGSGLALNDGVACNEHLQADGDAVFAAGDVVRWPNAIFPEEPTMRVEHWTNATEQGVAVARNVIARFAGEPLTPFTTVPFFWSDQFDFRVQLMGRASGDDETTVIEGDLDSDVFAVAFSRGGVIRGVLGVGTPKLVIGAKQFVARRASLDETVAGLVG